MELKVEELKESNEFLADLYEHLTTAIFLADSETRLVHFNNSFTTLFHRPEDAILGELCGNAIGCAFPLDEGTDCGHTSKCPSCPLRASIVSAFTAGQSTYGEELEREFVLEGRRIRKKLRFTTKLRSYRGTLYALVLLDDVTALAEVREELRAANAELARRNAELRALVDSLADELVAGAKALSREISGREELARELRDRLGNLLQVIGALVRDNETVRGSQRAAARIAAVTAAYAAARYEQGRALVDVAEFARTLGASVAVEAGARYLWTDMLEGQAGLDEALAFAIAVTDVLFATDAPARLELATEDARLCALIEGALVINEDDFRLARLLLGRVSGELRAVAGGARLCVPVRL